MPKYEYEYKCKELNIASIIFPSGTTGSSLVTVPGHAAVRRNAQSSSQNSRIIPIDTSRGRQLAIVLNFVYCEKIIVNNCKNCCEKMCNWSDVSRETEGDNILNLLDGCTGAVGLLQHIADNVHVIFWKCACAFISTEEVLSWVKSNIHNQGTPLPLYYAGLHWPDSTQCSVSDWYGQDVWSSYYRVSLVTTPYTRHVPDGVNQSGHVIE